MSATNRGGQRSEADFYATPAWCVRRLLERVQLPGGDWLEPGAGNGSIIRAVRSVRRDASWTAVELRPEAWVEASARGAGGAAWYVGDFLGPWPGSTAKMRFDVAIGNPPYSLALPFIERAMHYARVVVFLLRLDFLGSRGRAAFMRKTQPSVYVLPDRPSFRGKGTDSNEYAWFVWGFDAIPQIHVLDLTSPEEMERDRGQLGLFSPPPEEQATLV